MAGAARPLGDTPVEIAAPDLDLNRPLTAIWLGRHPSMLAQELMAIAAGAD